MDGMLQLKIAPWTRALVTRMVALGPALAIVLYASSADPKFDIIQAVCEGANVLQAMVLPFALVPALRFSSDPALVGELALGRCTRACAWAATAGILGSSVLSERAWHGSNPSNRGLAMQRPSDLLVSPLSIPVHCLYITLSCSFPLLCAPTQLRSSMLRAWKCQRYGLASPPFLSPTLHCAYDSRGARSREHICEYN